MSAPSTPLYQRFAKPSRFRLPGGAKPQDTPRLNQIDIAANTDEYGLGAWASDRCRAVRRYLAVTYDYFGFDKRKKPVEVFSVSFGTLPEVVVFGWLIVNNFTYQTGGPRSFDFQDPRLGGREYVGGAVVDFLVHYGNRKIAVRVSSVYHSAFDPFGHGGTKTQENIDQGVRLASRGGIDKVIDVNLPEQGFPLESGPDFLVDIDLARILVA